MSTRWESCDRERSSKKPPTLSSWEGLVEPASALAFQLRRRHPVHRSVVALAKPPVTIDRDLRPGECDLGGLDRAAKIRGEHRSEAFIAPALAKTPRLRSPGFGERSLQPTHRDTTLVVDADRVRLVDDADTHAVVVPGLGGHMTLRTGVRTRSGDCETRRVGLSRAVVRVVPVLFVCDSILE